MSKLLSKTEKLTDSNKFIEYWDSFITQDWRDLLHGVNNLGYTLDVSHESISFPKSQWLVFPRSSWMMMPKPYFGCPCLDEKDSLKGVFINLNPRCAKEQEEITDLEVIIRSQPYGIQSIYRFGGFYSRWVASEIQQSTNDAGLLWLKDHRVDWLSAVLFGQKDRIPVSRVLALEICPWHSAGWTQIEKSYILNNSDLIFNKIIIPAIYFSVYKINPRELMSSVVICYGADICHLLDQLISSGVSSIYRVNQDYLKGASTFDCSVYRISEDGVGTALFFVFKRRPKTGKGVDLPPQNPKIKFHIPELRSDCSLIEMIVYYKQAYLVY